MLPVTSLQGLGIGFHRVDIVARVLQVVLQMRSSRFPVFVLHGGQPCLSGPVNGHRVLDAVSDTGDHGERDDGRRRDQRDLSIQTQSDFGHRSSPIQKRRTSRRFRIRTVARKRRDDFDAARPGMESQSRDVARRELARRTSVDRRTGLSGHDVGFELLAAHHLPVGSVCQDPRTRRFSRDWGIPATPQ